MQNVLNKLFGRRKDKEFVALIQAALEDQTIRRNLLTLLALPQSQRLSQRQKWDIELEGEHTPQPLISTIGFLKDADIASRTLCILNNCSIYQLINMYFESVFSICIGELA